MQRSADPPTVALVLVSTPGPRNSPLERAGELVAAAWSIGLVVGAWWILYLNDTDRAGALTRARSVLDRIPGVFGWRYLHSPAYRFAASMRAELVAAEHAPLEVPA